MCETTTLMEILGYGLLALVMIAGSQFSKFWLFTYDRRKAYLEKKKQAAMDEAERTQQLLERLDAERAARDGDEHHAKR